MASRKLKAASQPLTLRLINACPRYPAPRALLRRVLGEAYQRRRKRRASLNLLLVTDRKMTALNRAHRGCRTTTDVLAFADGERDPESGLPHLGDIAVSVDLARREAGARGLRIRDELTLYALHGLLHLLGLRDDTAAGRRAMLRAQREEFRRQGLAFEM